MGNAPAHTPMIRELMSKQWWDPYGIFQKKLKEKTTELLDDHERKLKEAKYLAEAEREKDK